MHLVGLMLIFASVNRTRGRSWCLGSWQCFSPCWWI